MKYVYWDTSALIKRYHQEKGSDKVNEIFSAVIERRQQAFISYLGVLESLSAITRRKRHLHGKYNLIVKTVIKEITDYFTIIPIDDEIMELSMKMIFKYGLRTLDSIHLATAVHISRYLHTNEIMFISSDEELLHAAKMEGFEILNPEK